MSARRWWLLGGLQGGLSGSYHYIVDGGPGYRAACGAHSAGKFVKCDETPRERAARRCQRCVDMRTPEARAIAAVLEEG